jgi:hypothetical protein
MWRPTPSWANKISTETGPTVAILAYALEIVMWPIKAFSIRPNVAAFTT